MSKSDVHGQAGTLIMSESRILIHQPGGKPPSHRMDHDQYSPAEREGGRIPFPVEISRPRDLWPAGDGGGVTLADGRDGLELGTAVGRRPRVPIDHALGNVFCVSETA